ncbi:hypothetical protein D3C83_198060 [compost metagenome]
MLAGALLTERQRINDGALVARLVDSTQAEEVVVLRHAFDEIGSYIAHGPRTGPLG